MVEPESGNAARLARGFIGVGAAAVLANVVSYGLLILAATLLAPHDYSNFIALMNVALVGSVPAFALQVVTARHVAMGQTRDLMRVGTIMALGVGAVFVLLAPFEEAFLHLSGLSAAVLLGVGLPGVTLFGLCQGVWQGAQRYGALAVTSFVAVAARTGGGVIGLLIGRTTTSSILVLTLAVSMAAVVAVRLLPSSVRSQDEASRASRVSRPPAHLIVECIHAAHAYGAFLLLSVSDILLASHVLPTRAAAVYAAGSVMTKAALWLPQSAANVLFADMTDHDRHRGLFARAAGAITGLGVAVTAFCWLAGGVVAALVGANKYPELRHDIWIFAGLGSCLALTQFALVSGLAIRSRRVSVVVWVAVAAEALAVLGLGRDDGVRELVTTVTAINLAAVGCSLVLRFAHRPARPPSDQPVSSPGHGPGANSGS